MHDRSDFYLEKPFRKPNVRESSNFDKRSGCSIESSMRLSKQ